MTNFEPMMKKLSARPLFERIAIAVVALLVGTAVITAMQCDAKCKLNRYGAHLTLCASLMDANMIEPALDCMRSLVK